MELHYIGGIQRFSTEDGPGIRTTVFLKGCPLRCQWCHNPELLERGFGLLYREKECIRCGRCISACSRGALAFGGDQVQIDRAACIPCGACTAACCTGALFTKSHVYTEEELMDILAKDNDYYELSQGGITLSGGEVLSHGAYARELARRIKEAGWTLVVETSGFGPWEDLEALAAWCDWILFDLKVMDREKHKAYVGVYPDRIRQNLESLTRKPGVKEKIIIRVPAIGGVNDDEDNTRALGDYMVRLALHRVDILPYHNMGLSKAREAGWTQAEFETPSAAVLERNRMILEDAGLDVTVMGQEDQRAHGTAQAPDV